MTLEAPIFLKARTGIAAKARTRIAALTVRSSGDAIICGGRHVRLQYRQS
jgi:hypothetical protein